MASNVAAFDASGWLVQDECPVFAMDTIEIPAKETGYLASVLVKQNDEVEKGAVLASLDKHTAELELQVAALQAQVAAQEAADDSDIKLAEFILEETQIVLANFQTLTKRSAATETELRQKQIAVTQAQVKLTHAKQQAEQLKLRSRVAQASVLAAQDKIDRLQVTAPSEATVHEVLRKEGEWVQAGQSVCRLVRIQELRVDFFILRSEIDPASLVGRPVQASIRDSDDSPIMFAGTVTSYDPEVTSQGRVRVHATIQNQRNAKHWRLLPGMTVTLKTQPSATAPKSAARARNEQGSVK
jgi:multidrug efflux pump subunit AcrA (membrane-fusion protein)